MAESSGTGQGAPVPFNYGKKPPTNLDEEVSTYTAIKGSMETPGREIVGLIEPLEGIKYNDLPIEEQIEYWAIAGAVLSDRLYKQESKKSNASAIVSVQHQTRATLYKELVDFIGMLRRAKLQQVAAHTLEEAMQKVEELNSRENLKSTEETETGEIPEGAEPEGSNEEQQESSEKEPEKPKVRKSSKSSKSSKRKE